MYDFGQFVPFLEISFALNLGFTLWDELLKDLQTRIQESNDNLQEKIKSSGILSDNMLNSDNMFNNESENDEKTTIVRFAQWCGFCFCILIVPCILLIPHQTDVGWLAFVLLTLAPFPALVTCWAKLWHPFQEWRSNKKIIKDVDKVIRIEKKYTSQGKKVVEQGKSK